MNLSERLDRNTSHKDNKTRRSSPVLPISEIRLGCQKCDPVAESTLTENAEYPDDNFEAELLAESEHSLKQEKRVFLINRLLLSLLVILLVYMVILIYGVAVTNYAYDDSGQLAPVTMQISDIAKKSEYDVILAYYLQLRTEYEKILVYDYRVAKQEESFISIEPYYTRETEQINNLMTQLNGLDTNGMEHVHFLNMLYTECNYMALYCQYMSKYLSEMNEEAGNNAIADRNEYLQPYFQQITENLVTIGSSLKGVDVTDVTSWDPDKYIQKEILGMEVE